MLDFRRLRGTLMSLVCALAMSWLLALFLRLPVGRDSRWLRGNDWISYTLVSYDKAGRQISGVLKDVAGSKERLGFLLGTSSLECGVNPEALGTGTAMPWRWLSLCGKGGSGADFERMADLWLKSPLHPEVLVLAINLGMLAQPDPGAPGPEAEEVSFDAAAFADHVSARRWDYAGAGLRTLCVSVPNHVFPYRSRVNDQIQYGLLVSRIGLFDSLGLGPFEAFPPSPNPWRIEWPDWGTVSHDPEAHFRAQFANYRRRGWLGAENYYSNSENIKAFVRLIGKVRSRGTRVVIVLMPEWKRATAEFPREAEAVMKGALAKAFGEKAPNVIDLRSAMSDDRFIDATHLNPEGKKEFTERLSRELTSRLLAENRKASSKPGADQHASLGVLFAAKNRLMGPPDL